MLEQVRAEYGSWHLVCDAARISNRVCRGLRHGRWRAASYYLLDKIFSRTDHEWFLEQLEWYTPEQLVDMGIWKPMTESGLKQNQAKRRAGSA